MSSDTPFDVARAREWLDKRTCTVPSVTLENGEVVYQIKYYPVRGPDNVVHIDRVGGLGLFHRLSYYWLRSFIDDDLYPNLASILALGSTSRAWHWYTSQQKLWKLFTRRMFKGKIDYCGNWKDSLVRHINNQFRQQQGRELIPPYRTVDPSIAPYWTGMENELKRTFKYWYRHAINPRYWDVSCPRSPQIERIPWTEISVEQFQEKYEAPGRPVIISGFAEKWPAWNTWCQKLFLERYGDEVWRCGSGFKMEFSRYVQYLENRTDPLPLYLFDQRYHIIAPEIARESGIPEYFPEDLFSIVGEEDRPPYRWILCGPSGSSVPFHVDPHGTSAWNVVVKGKKRWGFYPPGVQPPAVGPYSPKYYFAPSGQKWLLNVRPTLSPEKLPWECMQEEGDLLFVPSGWWHLVYNVCGDDPEQNSETPDVETRSDDLCIAMTQNYCSRQNFHIIAALLSDEERKSSFARRFKEELEEQHPDLFAKWEQVAEKLRKDRVGLIRKWGLVLKEEVGSSSSSSDSS